MSFKFDPHQARAIPLLKRNTRAVLPWKPGWGKTAPTLEAAYDRSGADPVIWCTDKVGVHDAARQAREVLGPDVTIQIAKDGKQRLNAKIIILPYSLVFRPGIIKQVNEMTIGCLVVDEFHRCKNPKAKRTDAVLGPNGFHKRARNVYFLSGTPAPNHGAELYPLFASGFPGVITPDGSSKPLNFYEFRDFTCHVAQTAFGTQIVGTNTKHTNMLWNGISEFVIDADEQEVLSNIGDLRISHYPVEADSSVGNLQELEDKYSADIAEVIEAIEEGRPAPMHLATLFRVTETAKVLAASELANLELANAPNEKIVIFAKHRDPIRALQANLAAHNPVTIDGTITGDNRKRAIEAFQDDPKVRVCIAQINAASTAITLHSHGACRNVIFLSADWTPANNSQAIARVHRRGQPHLVTVRFLHIEDSLDEIISTTLVRKSQELAQIFDTRRRQNNAA